MKTRLCYWDQNAKRGQGKCKGGENLLEKCLKNDFKGNWLDADDSDDEVDDANDLDVESSEAAATSGHAEGSAADDAESFCASLPSKSELRQKGQWCSHVRRQGRDDCQMSYLRLAAEGKFKPCVWNDVHQTCKSGDVVRCPSSTPQPTP